MSTCEHPPSPPEAAGRAALERSVRAVLWDLDGTLVESIEATEAAWRTWSHERGLTGFRHAEFHGMPARAIVATQVPKEEVEEALELIEALEEDQVTGIVARAGAERLIARLGTAPWAIVTSSTSSLARLRLRTARLPVPSVLVAADSVTHGKPDPEGYLLAATRLGIAPEETLAIEDSPTGLTAARRAGCLTIGVGGTYDPGQLTADVVVSELAEIDLEVLEDQTIHVRVGGT